MAKQNRWATQRVTLSAMLLAMMLVLGWVESLLPSAGIPGVKLGLSNGILIFAVYMLDIPTAYILMALKVTLSGLLFSGVQTMMYGFAGGLLSLTGMCLLSLIPRLSPVPVSMAGGLLHNVGQVGVAMLILQAPRQMLAYMGTLMLVGLGSGLLTGVVAATVMRHVKHIGLSPRQAAKQKKRWPLLLAAGLVLLAGLIAYLALPKAADVTVTTEPAPTGEAPVQLMNESQVRQMVLPTGGDTP